MRARSPLILSLALSASFLSVSLLSVAVPGTARAQGLIQNPPGDQAPPPDPKGTLSFALENDMFGGSDRYYTNGFADTDSALAAGEAANMAKYAAAEAAVHAVDAAVQTHGGNGITQEYGMAGLLVAARAGRIAPVSREMILNFVAMHSLGLPKSY